MVYILKLIRTYYKVKYLAVSPSSLKFVAVLNVKIRRKLLSSGHVSCSWNKILDRTADAAGAVSPVRPPPVGTLFAESMNLRKCFIAYCAHNRIISPIYMPLRILYSLILDKNYMWIPKILIEVLPYRCAQTAIIQIVTCNYSQPLSDLLMRISKV